MKIIIPDLNKDIFPDLDQLVVDLCAWADKYTVILYSDTKHEGFEKDKSDIATYSREPQQ